jgi:hypothetical protein
MHFDLLEAHGPVEGGQAAHGGPVDIPSPCASQSIVTRAAGFDLLERVDAGLGISHAESAMRLMTGMARGGLGMGVVFGRARLEVT